MSHPRTLLLCAGYMALLVIAAVAADRVIANRTIPNPGTFVPAYRSFQEFFAGEKLRQVDEVGGLPSVFIGNSRTVFGVDPLVFDRSARAGGARIASYNLAMPTVDPRFWPLFFGDYYAERAPERVLYGITARDMDARNTSAEAYQAAFLASPGFANRNRSGIWKQAEEVLAQMYTLRGRVEETIRFNRRDFFRLAGQRDRLRQYTLANARGHSAFPARYTKPESLLLRERERYAGRVDGNRLRPARDRIHALEQLHRWVRAHGGCLTFFTLPVYYDPEPWGTEAMRRDLARLMRRLVRALPGTDFVDVGDRLQRSYTVKEFGDPDHLNARGAERFSADLANALAPTLGRGCGGP
ncbi:MAG: SGNH/GDSL hydrolase family protein [Solirubrobacteraceae bacterium]|nr:SGNH/GDSL hydrolase family protein [Solirubrobacteraceae bacterium]